MGYRFLAADDEKLALDRLLGALRKAEPGCNLRGFTAAGEALAEIDGGFVPDVAFLDIEMPGMTGIELAKHIRERSPDTYIVFVTAFDRYALEAFRLHAHGYLTKPVTAAMLCEELKNLRSLRPITGGEEKLQIQCFGNFEVFYDGQPLRFERSKTKELLAYLVDRRGAGCTTAQICAVLWEDRAQEASIRNQLRVLVSDLTRTLNAAGVAKVLKKRRGLFGIATDQVDCDYYNFLRRDAGAVNTYTGEYMSQYSWAEMTLGALELRSGGDRASKSGRAGNGKTVSCSEP